MTKKLAEDARRAIELIEATGIAKRRGVLVLVFSRHGRGGVGYLNANPYYAARAMVAFLLREFPDAKRPEWLKRATAPKARHKGRSGRRSIARG